MFIETKLNNLVIYYTQQPILRLITYLNTQMLPSFDTGSQAEANSQISSKSREPEPSLMQLKVNLNNVSVFVEPDPLDTTKR